MTQRSDVYGKALYELCASEHCEDGVLQELTVLSSSFSQEPDFLRLLSAPTLTKTQRCGIIDESFQGKVHPYVLNFLKILTEKGCIRHFSDCFKAFQSCYDDDHGILPVTAVSAVALTEEQTARLTEKLEKRTGKTVRLTVRIDGECLGGLRLIYDGQHLDGTIAARLRSIRSQLTTDV